MPITSNLHRTSHVRFAAFALIAAVAIAIPTLSSRTTASDVGSQPSIAAASPNETAQLGAGLADWGTIASVGTVDDAHVNHVVFNGATAAIRSNVNSTNALIRYNIPAVDEFKTSTADGITLAVRLRDNGSAARVRVWVKELNVVNGSVTTIAYFDSSNFAPSSSFRLAEVDFCGVEFDFFNNVYFVEARLQKTAQWGNPAISTIQINQVFCD